ncbi:MAG TPA: hypothetical protein VK504_27285 [Vicinamibacterales bacterium]|nr:hypothetical protein [Vicinamibacterales bacterium]
MSDGDKGVVDELTRDGNVVEFGPVIVDSGKREMPRRKDRDYSKRHCEHNRPVIDEDLHIVECEACGSPLDPVNVLLDLSRHWGDYAAAQMGEELQSFRNAAWYLQQNELRERRTPEERDMTHEQITKRHNEAGCPPDRIVLTQRYMKCYCGTTMSRVHHRELEARVLAAQNRRKPARFAGEGGQP